MTIQVSTEAELFAEGKKRGLARAKEKGLSGKFAERFATSFATDFVKYVMEAKENIARNCINVGIRPLELISEACGLPLQRVQELAATN